VTVRAVVFDLDGVLLDSEQVWDDVRQRLAADHGRAWPEAASHAMMGMSTPEWASYLVEVVGLPMSAERAAQEVVDGVLAAYSDDPPLLPGALTCVAALAQVWPLGLASSSARPIIDAVLASTGLDRHFSAVLSSEETAKGKPSPDVYLAAAGQLGVAPTDCVAVEDSSNGIRAAHAAGMAVVAVPNPHYPPVREALALASVTIAGVSEVTVPLVRDLGGG
jgi:HAD superfamily hydrolase (TIGR01509 family)